MNTESQKLQQWDSNPVHFCLGMQVLGSGWMCLWSPSPMAHSSFPTITWWKDVPRFPQWKGLLMAMILYQLEGGGNVLFGKPLRNLGGRLLASFEPEYQTCNFTDENPEGREMEFGWALGINRMRTKPSPPDCQFLPFPLLPVFLGRSWPELLWNSPPVSRLDLEVLLIILLQGWLWWKQNRCPKHMHEILVRGLWSLETVSATWNVKAVYLCLVLAMASKTGSPLALKRP